jgi:hypothetical protein
MIVIESIRVTKPAKIRQPVSSRIQRQLARLEQLVAGPLLWLGLPLLALMPLLME